MVDTQKNSEFEEFKQRGNDFFKQSHFSDAIEWYNKALEVYPNSAIVLANRSACNLKLENYGFAESDATKAIEADPKYIKGYYRRGSAYFSMGKFKEAIRDLKTVCRIVPKDKEAIQKLQTAQKEFKALKFAECFARDTIVKVLNPEEIVVSDTYTGLHLPETITLSWVQELMNSFKLQQKLHKKYAVIIIQRTRELLSGYKSLVNIQIPSTVEFNVCGDVHGQYYDLLNIFEINGLPSETNPYLFNGDFVDRGSFSLEVILLLFAWKLCYPDYFHLVRGNHETRNMNKMYGFEGEVKSKYDMDVMELFSETFCYLPLCAVLNNKIMVVHGGLFNQDGVTLKDIENIDRVKEPPDSGIMCDILWADPIKQNGRHPSKRGVGLCFGPDIAHRFLDENRLDTLVRSHEVKDNGYEEEASGRVITIFSAPNYCDQMNNKGAILKFHGSNLNRRYVTFNAVVIFI
jgi:serine/threonine-protein phosphatase 5